MHSLLSLLQTIQQQSHQLHDCLLMEKQALDNNEYERLNELSQRKQSLVEQLQQLDQQRAAISGNENFNDFIAASRDQALISQWQNTRQLIAECQQQNEINGRLLNRRSQLNQDVLSILSGRTQPADETYNARGSQSKSASLLNGVKA